MVDFNLGGSLNKRIEGFDFLGYSQDGDYYYKHYKTKDRERCGVTIDFYNQLFDEYKRIKVLAEDAGVLQKEKTPEEMAKEQENKIDQILELVKNYGTRLSKLESKPHEIIDVEVKENV